MEWGDCELAVDHGASRIGERADEQGCIRIEAGDPIVSLKMCDVIKCSKWPTNKARETPDHE